MANCPWVQCDVLWIKPFRNVRTIDYLRTVRREGIRILRILVSSQKRGWPSLKDLVLCERQIRKNLVPGKRRIK